MPVSDDSYDAFQRRCPRLGGPVPFSYCRGSASGEEVCFKALDCWWESFDVAAFLKARLSSEAYHKLHHRPPPDKLTSLVDLIRQAQDRVQNKD